MGWRQFGRALLPQRPAHRRVTRQQFGEAWPLAVEAGEVRCDRMALIFRADDGREFALNGVAASRGYADIEPIHGQRFVGARGLTDEEAAVLRAELELKYRGLEKAGEAAELVAGTGGHLEKASLTPLLESVRDLCG